MERYLCIHGHFYQPPRENPWLEAAAGLARSLPFEVDLWTAQNVCYELLQTAYPEFRRRAEQGQQSAQQWSDHFTSLGEKLGVLVA